MKPKPTLGLNMEVSKQVFDELVEAGFDAVYGTAARTAKEESILTNKQLIRVMAMAILNQIGIRVN